MADLGAGTGHDGWESRSRTRSAVRLGRCEARTLANLRGLSISCITEASLSLQLARDSRPAPDSRRLLGRLDKFKVWCDALCACHPQMQRVFLQRTTVVAAAGHQAAVTQLISVGSPDICWLPSSFHHRRGHLSSRLSTAFSLTPSLPTSPEGAELTAPSPRLSQEPPYSATVSGLEDRGDPLYLQVRQEHVHVLLKGLAKTARLPPAESSSVTRLYLLRSAAFLLSNSFPFFLPKSLRYFS
jgi:hypothetical protein